MTAFRIFGELARRSASGARRPVPAATPSGRCLFNQRTFAGTCVNERGAPTADLANVTAERLGSTRRRKRRQLMVLIPAQSAYSSVADTRAPALARSRWGGLVLKSVPASSLVEECAPSLTPILPSTSARRPARDRRDRACRPAPRRRARRHAGPDAPAPACGDRAAMPRAISRRERQAEGRAARPPPRCRRHAPWGRGAVA